MTQDELDQEINDAMKDMKRKLIASFNPVPKSEQRRHRERARLRGGWVKDFRNEVGKVLPTMPSLRESVDVFEAMLNSNQALSSKEAAERWATTKNWRPGYGSMQQPARADHTHGSGLTAMVDARLTALEANMARGMGVQLPFVDSSSSQVEYVEYGAVQEKKVKAQHFGIDRPQNMLRSVVYQVIIYEDNTMSLRERGTFQQEQDARDFRDLLEASSDLKVLADQ